MKITQAKMRTSILGILERSSCAILHLPNRFSCRAKFTDMFSVLIIRDASSSPFKETGLASLAQSARSMRLSVTVV